jgi:prepilin-type N-terminal cleavage/methylation domain-containing protein
MWKKRAGFTLIELLAALLIMSIVMVGVIGVFSSQNKTYIQQDLTLAMEENLRIAMAMVTDNLRTTGYGVPTTSLSSWVPWVSGFTSNPQVTQGSGSNPDTISVAACTSQSVATLSVTAASGATSLSLSSTADLDASNKRLIQIGSSENAHVISVSGSSITIDTNPSSSGNQGLSRAYLTGTPICRVNVSTFDIDTTNKALRLNENKGAGAQPAVEGISDLQITTVTASQQYQVALTARTEKTDPITGTYLTRSLTSDVTLKN